MLAVNYRHKIKNKWYELKYLLSKWYIIKQNDINKYITLKNSILDLIVSYVE